MLECGSLDVGNVQGDLNLREVEECVPRRQRYFLERADTRSKRLWFLWKEEEGEGGKNGGVRCGCCGGCVFHDGCIQREQPKDKSESVVYTAPTHLVEALKSEASPAIHKLLGLQSLRRTLPSLCVRDLDCVQYLHHGLLGHYELRYGGEPSIQQRSSAAAKEVSEHGKVDAQESSSVGTNSDGSFVSARSSLTSLLEHSENFVSIPNMNEVGVPDYGSSLPPEGKRRHRKARSHDLKSMSSAAGGKEGTDSATVLFYDPLNSASAFKGLVPAQLYRPAVLYVPLKKGKSENRRREAERKSNDHHHHRRQHSHGSPLIARQVDSADTQSLPIPPTQTSGGASPVVFHSQSSQNPSEHRDAFRIRVPILSPLSGGNLPAMVPRNRGGKLPTKRRRMGHWRDDRTGDDQTDEKKLAKVSLSVCVNGTAIAVLSPPLLNFVDR